MARTNPMVSNLSSLAAGLIGASCSAHCPQIVPPKPQGIGRQTDTSPYPLTAPPHNNAIESLRQELLGKINGQANNIRALHSSNTKLKLSNDDLKSKVNGLKSSNDELKSSNDELKSSNDELKSSNDE